ncbi:MAG: hypothetical protein QOK40_2824 [Miltoncostaeaceae bacterium]|nr:hypothetical protein [Miltoncostaeaceae bacterium]
MPVHLTPDELALMFGVEAHVVLNAAREVDVPVYDGRIDSVLFSQAIIAADHHLSDRAREVLQAEGGR